MATKYQSVLIAVDASEEADQVLEAATTVDPRGAARFKVVTVIPPVMGGISGMDGASFAATWPLRDMEESITKEITETVRERVARFGIAPDQVDVLYGRPAPEIRAYAERVGADLIVIGSHGRHTIPQVMLGSTANGVLHGARCDVLTVRIHERETQ
jgi:universal stress protein A